MDALVVLALMLLSGLPQAATPVYGYRVVHAFPHDRHAFTEGLFYLGGYLYESTGIAGQSSVRKVRLETGAVVQEYRVPPQYFGEGIVNWKENLLQLTWRSETGFRYDLRTFRTLSEFHYSGEGWALTQNGREIIMDDGTPQIRFWDPTSLRERRRITVSDQGQPVSNLNELEWVKGEIYANIWHSHWIARIDPASGNVVGWIDLTGLIDERELDGDSDSVLNGIAYDAVHDRLFVTGKRWPKLFEIQVKAK
jgi:glutaminyl-peptide cyclotransferase